MMVLSGSQTARAAPKKPMKKLAITQDDSKILGRVDKKLEKTLPPSKFSTNLYKTQNSTWTPLVNKPANQQVKYIFYIFSDFVVHYHAPFSQFDSKTVCF